MPVYNTPIPAALERGLCAALERGLCAAHDLPFLPFKPRRSGNSDKSDFDE